MTRTVPVTRLPPEPASPLRLRSARFRRDREAAWAELERVTDRLEAKGLRALTTDEIMRLPVLYRTAASSLSVARAIALDRRLLSYLENLTLRAYLAVYSPRLSLLAGFRAFLAHGLRAGIRSAAREIGLALLIILAGTAFGYLLVEADEGWFAAIVPSGLASGRSGSSTRGDLLRNEIFAPWPGFTESFVVFAGMLFRHNMLVGLTTFGLGLLAGVPTVLLLAYQGMTFGAFMALHQRRGLLVDFLGWVSVHGVTEFGAIVLCGAGGLVVAEAMLFPGPLRRLDNLAAGGRRAAVLVGGAVILFMVAGLLEGGLRQLLGTTDSRFAVAAVVAYAWFLYLRPGAGRPADAG